MAPGWQISMMLEQGNYCLGDGAYSAVCGNESLEVGICRDAALDIRGIICKLSLKTKQKCTIDTLRSLAAHTKKRLYVCAADFAILS